MNAMELWLQRMAMREVGALHLSIGTSLALESFCGILPEQETKFPLIEKVQEIWINVRTLVRNMHGALDHETKELIAAEILVQGVMEEIQIIEGVLQRYSGGRCKPVFYYCGYLDLVRKYPNAMLKEYKTPKQQFYRDLEQKTVHLVSQNSTAGQVVRFENGIKGSGLKVAMITHCPVDLLHRYEFLELQLLESHTGKVKPPALWNTKLQGGKDLPRIPFNKMTLQLFGDGVMFSPMPMKIRKFIVDLAESDRWNTATTKEKIIYSIKQKRDPVAEAFYLSLF